MCESFWWLQQKSSLKNKKQRFYHSPIMPLSEFLRLAIEKLEASKKKSSSADLSVPGTENNNIVEVVWEDSSTHHSLSPNTPSVLDATLGNSITESLGGVDSSIFDDMSPVVPPGELDLIQNDEVLLPCLNYPVDDGPQDYFTETSGVKANETSESKRRTCDEAITYLDNNGQDAFKFSSCKPRFLCSWPPQQGQTFCLSGFSSVNCQDVMFGNGAKVYDVVSDLMGKHAAIVKANIPISGGISSTVKETDPACRCSSPAKSNLLQRLTSKRKGMDIYAPSATTMVNSGQLSVKDHKEKDFCRKTGKALTQNIVLNSTTVIDGARSAEPVFASSSVGSGNSVDIVSYEETHNFKRKFCDIESECRSDDIQIESIGVKKASAAGGDTGARKSRTAEVHNLSERRRRDRINDKMRALQELVPNCNKADKASMLDDAIQYLKNLQHQLQTYKSMSMGGGVCVQPMMFAQGSQHVYSAPISHYSPMGVGMGMGMNMSYSMFPVHTNYQGSNHPIHGHLCPGFHTTVPRPPLRITTQNEAPSTSLNLNSEDPMKSTNMHNAAGGSRPVGRVNKQDDRMVVCVNGWK